MPLFLDSRLFDKLIIRQCCQKFQIVWVWKFWFIIRQLSKNFSFEFLFFFKIRLNCQNWLQFSSNLNRRMQLSKTYLGFTTFINSWINRGVQISPNLYFCFRILYLSSYTLVFLINLLLRSKLYVIFYWSIFFISKSVLKTVFWCTLLIILCLWT